MKTFINTVIGLLLTLVSINGNAYSYAAAGKEPVIDGREAILIALSAQDYTQVTSEVNKLSDELDYLKKEHNVDLQSAFERAIVAKDANAISALLDTAVYEEIVRRLDGAQGNLNDYQVAKVLVVKSKLFLDLLSPNLSGELRLQSSEAISGLLKSIGNPGVFGVGQAPADPTMFQSERSKLLQALAQFKQ
ncbi:hypothetical protein [Aliivibrio kagoshimensis]|uniref:hypothetical protein n=1 Tax=Aliivibrio kagoshimensis TaxID=2910230 RepID=UPI003D0E1EA5